ncbi:PD-(D/E)XK nuclease family protein [Sinomicrobium kalidii]|uniref:PDDEXK-like family protein n=1 Tax=Sinomicrobium kalidii TaxID=2900738 RepID=UPI001E3FDA65|nr:PD-(D/E)XK nuclease family protein [Sinomicrobium kalidii]UGU17956.1 PD-(D/E)XK nuclease family protein [Sinomicrobium kalidii]
MKYKILFDKVRTIVKHHTELKQLKGENFNVFDILNLQTNEVRTHSAFLAELLNPKGSHLMGSLFLEDFLAIINHDINGTEEFDISTASVLVEAYIGKVEKETGGRIDILLTDSKGNTITIENKIDAGDQENQILRYYNYNESKNTVYYLNKYGDEPSENSKNELESGSDFHIISYRNHIISWLDKCNELAADQPILRESIKQYNILIKKLTNTLENKQEMELKKLILDNLEEAELIAQKYDSVLARVREDFRIALIEELTNYREQTDSLKNYNIKANKAINATYSGIWIPQTENSKKMFGVCGFSGKGHINGDFFVGLYNETELENTDLKGIDSNKNWRHYKVLTCNFKENPEWTINCSDKDFLKYIANPENLKQVVNEVKKQIIDFIEKYIGYVS